MYLVNYIYIYIYIYSATSNRSRTSSTSTSAPSPGLKKPGHRRPSWRPYGELTPPEMFGRRSVPSAPSASCLPQGKPWFRRLWPHARVDEVLGSRL